MARPNPFTNAASAIAADRAVDAVANDGNDTRTIAHLGEPAIFRVLATTPSARFGTADSE